ncbi:peptide hydrolase [Wenjunlia tyrosinilytica]|uniref:Peptide hydrolase n=2 Tax=Wenjunlia tyrosinilytica TaxID=1544741 RepID=A0A918E0J2_9ACTN|nr:peptide hydrolase [Wenjunlia tyrosinilytica]
MVLDGPDGETLAVWDTTEAAPVPLPGDFGDPKEAVLTADGACVLGLRDDNGSEMGHVWAAPAGAGAGAVDLTPGLPPYTLRGIDVGRYGSRAVITAVADDGFTLWLVDSGGNEQPRRLFTSRNEAWNGLISATGELACIDTTEHNPGFRRFAVTVVDTGTGRVVASLSDGPEAPVRAVRFSPVAGDGRLLAATERTGYARPCVWNPADGTRIDADAPGLDGDLVPLDWSDDASRVLLVHVDAGVHQVMELDLATGGLSRIEHPPGAFFEPDVAAAHLYSWASHYAADGRIRLLHQRFDQPLTVLHVDQRTGEARPGWQPRDVGPGTAVVSRTVRSADGTAVQLWVGRPPGADRPTPLVLYLHGGPQMATVDRYNPEAQAWLASGTAYAALNYRGSVTFGRAFREGFFGTVGAREVEDIEAAVGWLVAEGIADKENVFVTGPSYGGFLSLLAVGRLPDLFAGAFAFVPMADWVSAHEDMNPALRTACRSFFRASLEEDPGRYVRASPISYVGQVRSPVWIRHATHDTRTPPSQAHSYALALERAGGDVVLDWFSGGHETSSRDMAIGDQQRMMDLVQSALRGERWSRSRVRPPDPDPDSAPDRDPACRDH